MLIVFGSDPKPINIPLQKGSFEGRIPVGEGYLLMIQAPGFAEYRVQSLGVYEGMPELTFRLKPLTPVRGLIVDPRPEPSST